MASEDSGGLKMFIDDCTAVKCLVTKSVKKYLESKYQWFTDENLLGIECPSCESMFHLKCIDIGSIDIYNLLGNYIPYWRCFRCVDVLSRESQIFTGKLIELRQRQILLQLKENENQYCGGTDTNEMENYLLSIDNKLEEMLEIMKQKSVANE